MSRYMFDIETDDLLKNVTKQWILYTIDLDSGEKRHWLDGDLGWKKVLSEATLLVGHNICNFDLMVLEKLFNFIPSKHTKIHDTLILSQVLDYKRFGTLGHGLATWGLSLDYPKGDYDDWSHYSEEMLKYCERDCDLNEKVYRILIAELNEKKEKSPKLIQYIKAEHAATTWVGRASLYGWPFDLKAAHDLFDTLQGEMDNAYNILNERLGLKVVAKDKCKGIVTTKKPKWTKMGFYDAHTSNWFGIDPCSGFEDEERMVEGPYSRVEIVPLKLSSVTDVKTFLFRHGWVPTEFNFKMCELTRKKKKTSPKITEDSLEFLGGDGKIYTDYLTSKARFSILKTWIENTDENGNLHGDCMVIGTPSMRARHSIIVNVPSGDSKWGPEMRKLFRCKEGWKLVGCDSAGNQARGLAHYLNDEGFTKTLLEGDIHQYNADTLTAVLKGMGNKTVVSRPQAKRILYAFLFGASGGKLWSYIFGTINASEGKKLKDGFTRAVPGFKNLLDKLERLYDATSERGSGYITSIAGNRIYVDSLHKLLVYLLQSCEKVTCASAVMLTMERLEEACIPYMPCIFYHDEFQFMVPEAFADKAVEIGISGFKEGPKLFGVNIMDGSGSFGDNWYDTH